MAELTSLLRTISKLFLQKALLFMFIALILPLSPSQAPEFFTNHTIVNKIWELIHLLFIGLAISYGIFSRRNTETVTGKELGSEPDNPNSYVCQILPGLEDKEEEEGKEQQIWSNKFDMTKPSTIIDKPLFLPVRSLNQQTEKSNKDENCTVLPSPIPWRSRLGRIEARDEVSAPKIKSSNLPSPHYKRLSPSPSPSPSLSRENSEKKKTLYKEITSWPPVPPPPPPPFLGHAYQPPFLGRRAKSNMRSFRDELKDVSMRPKPRPRTSFDSSSSFSPPIAKPVRAYRPKDTPIEPPKRTVLERRDEDTIERVSIYSDSDDVSESTDSEVEEEEEEEIEGYSDKEVIEKPKFSTTKVEEKKRVNEEDVNEVDKKADEFIAKFREQIRLQRIESIKRSAGERAVRSHKKMLRD
jgi:Cotton fibre expressed protein